MDALSHLLADVRIRQAVFVRTRLAPTGQLRVSEAGQPSFHLVTQGRVWLDPMDGSAPVLLEAGDVAFIPRGSAHRLCGQDNLQQLMQPIDIRPHWQTHGVQAGPVDAMPPGSLEVVGRTLSGAFQIEGVTSAWLWGGLPPWLTLQWGAKGVPQWLMIGLTYLEQELSRDRPARQAIIDRLGDVLFIQSLRSYLVAGGTRGPTGWLMGLKDSMVSRVLGAMHRDPAHPWTLAELASQGCVSRTVLAERFSQLLGVPPLTYLTSHRMHLAARRLREGRQSVAEVAQQVGYQSSAAFAQAFKREMGCSPRDWRAQAQADVGEGQGSSSTRMITSS
ncbi:MAG: hypothetical protein RLZZ182_2504 [Pseudomonadota bacterium]